MRNGCIAKRPPTIVPPALAVEKRGFTFPYRSKMNIQCSVCSFTHFYDKQ